MASDDFCFFLAGPETPAVVSDDFFLFAVGPGTPAVASDDFFLFPAAPAGPDNPAVSSALRSSYSECRGARL